MTMRLCGSCRALAPIVELAAEQYASAAWSKRAKLEKRAGDVESKRQYGQGLADARVLVVDDNATNRKTLYHQILQWKMQPDCADGVFRSTYLPWIDSITHVRAAEKEEIELSLNSNYENVWRLRKERPEEPAVRLKSQYSSRLYRWAKQYIVVGQKRVSVGTLRKILGLEDVKDNSGRVVQDAPLELWANLKQRALDRALKEINKQSDIQLELEFVGRGAFRKVLSLGFRITERKNAGGKGAA